MIINNQSSGSGLGSQTFSSSFKSQSSGFSGFGESKNNVEIEALLTLARNSGGNISEVADELTNHNRSILSIS